MCITVFALLLGALIVLFCEQGANVKCWKVICCFEYDLHCTEYDLDWHSEYFYVTLNTNTTITTTNSTTTTITTTLTTTPLPSLTALHWGSSKYLAAQETLSKFIITISSHGGQLPLPSGSKIRVNKGILVPNLWVKTFLKKCSKMSRTECWEFFIHDHNLSIGAFYTSHLILCKKPPP